MTAPAHLVSPHDCRQASLVTIHASRTGEALGKRNARMRTRARLLPQKTQTAVGATHSCSVKDNVTGNAIKLRPVLSYLSLVQSGSLPSRSPRSHPSGSAIIPPSPSSVVGGVGRLAPALGGGGAASHISLVTSSPPVLSAPARLPPTQLCRAGE